VSWQWWTRVEIAVVLRQQVDVVEDETVPVTQFQRLDEPDVHQHAAVERARRRLCVRPHHRNTLHIACSWVLTETVGQHELQLVFVTVHNTVYYKGI